MKKIILSTLLLLSGCSLFIKATQSEISVEKIESVNTEKILCQNQPQWITSNPEALKIFLSTLEKGGKTNSTFQELAALYALLLMRVRPDFHSPTSRLQILFFDGKEWNWWDQFVRRPPPEDPNSGISPAVDPGNEIPSWDSPYFSVLESLLKTAGRGPSLAAVIENFDNAFSFPLPVSEVFATTLSQNRGPIAGHPALSRYFLRGEDLLRQGESLPVFTILPVYRKSQIKNLTAQKDFFLEEESGFQCNFSPSTHENSPFLVSETEVQSGFFALSDGRQFLLANSYQEVDYGRRLSKTPFFFGQSETRGPALCFGKTQKGNPLALVSTASRDPSQHLMHLFQYGLKNISLAPELNSFLNFSRHLFLPSPTRLIFESERATDEQKSNLLSFKIPLYHADRLGVIYAGMASDSVPSLHADSRGGGVLICPKDP